MAQLTLFEDARAEALLKDLDNQLDELELSPEQRKAVYLQILWRLLSSSLHPSTATATLANLLENNLR